MAPETAVGHTFIAAGHTFFAVMNPRPKFAGMKSKIVSLFFLLLVDNAFSQSVPDSIPASVSADSIGAGIELGEVVVSARRPDALVTADKITYSPDATLSGSGGTVYDAISSLPGVNMDAGGSISVNGVKNVSVSIDGHKSVLTGETLMTYLKSLPSGRVRRMEIVTTPSARRDASSAPVTLNLEMKRVRDHCFSLGMNGSGHIFKAKRGFGAIHAGYSNRRLSTSVTYSFIAARNPSELFTVRPLSDGNGCLIQTYDRRRKDRIHNVTGMLDYDIAKEWKLGATMTGNWFHRRERAAMDTENLSDATTVHTENFTDTRQRNIFGNLYLKHGFLDRKGDVTLGVDGFSYRSDETQDMANSMDGVLDGAMGGTVKGVIATLDFTRDLSRGFRLSAGLKSSLLRIKNGGRYDGSVSEDTSTDDNLSSGFKYRENVNAAYAECRFNSWPFSLSAGVRMEHTGRKSLFSGNEVSGSADYRRSSFGIFPNASAKIRVGEYGDALIGYLRGITRPRYADLNPFIYIFDDITHVGGNVNLHEAVSNTLQMVYTHDSRLRVSITATEESGAIVKCYREITDGVLYVSPENLPRRLGASLTVSAVNLRMKDWWTLSVNATVLYNNYKFGSGLNLGGNCRFTPMLDFKNLFRFPSGWGAELSGRWNGRMAYGQATVGAYGSVYVGVRKSVLSGKGNVTLFVRDLFNTNHNRSVISLPSVIGTLTEREYEMMRVIGASFSLRFDVGKVRHAQPRHKELIDEIKRVNL